MEKQRSFRKHLQHSQLKSAEKRVGTKAEEGAERSPKVIISLISIPSYCLHLHFSCSPSTEAQLIRHQSKSCSYGKNTDVCTSRATLTWFAERWNKDCWTRQTHGLHCYRLWPARKTRLTLPSRGRNRSWCFRGHLSILFSLWRRQTAKTEPESTFAFYILCVFFRNDTKHSQEGSHYSFWNFVKLPQLTGQLKFTKNSTQWRYNSPRAD